MTAITRYELTPDGEKFSPRLILAHGAGAPADSVFMECLANALAEEGITTVRFEFPYMEKRREDGRKRPPDRQPVLLEHFREVIRQVMEESSEPLFIGGKSMGGRMASLLAAQPENLPINGCICFGYPFHPPGKQDRWRVAHFKDFERPVAVIQGTRDPFGKQDETHWPGVLEGANCDLHWLSGGNHDFRPPAKQAETQEQLIQAAARIAARFIREV